jgi:hypothetical protein
MGFEDAEALHPDLYHVVGWIKMPLIAMPSIRSSNRGWGRAGRRGTLRRQYVPQAAIALQVGLKRRPRATAVHSIGNGAPCRPGGCSRQVVLVF